MKNQVLVGMFVALLVSLPLSAQELESRENPVASQATSLLGKPLYAARPSSALLEKLANHKANFESSPTADNLIWFARFQAYAGKYQAAIDTYSDGIARFPDDPRLYRHRGHRLISIRQFKRALADFDRAVQLIAGKPNEIEPDGMPNARNIPVSTLHGNIYYHKGLAHYLRNEMPEALEAYRNCLATADLPDNVVSATHWIYSILRRLDRDEEAEKALDAITSDMSIIENHSYHQACLFYKGELTLDELLASLDETPAGDSVRYALANWYFCNGGDDMEKAKVAFRELVSADGWASFGHIAAEADLARLQKNPKD